MTIPIPHLARLQLVTTPYGCRHLVHELEQLTCAVGIVTEALRAFNRLSGVRDDAIPPAADLVPEQANATGRARPTAPSPTTPRSLRSLHAGACSITNRPSGTCTSSAEW
jgi:hypothetical protein